MKSGTELHNMHAAGGRAVRCCVILATLARDGRTRRRGRATSPVIHWCVVVPTNERRTRALLAYRHRRRRTAPILIVVGRNEFCQELWG